MENKTGSNEEVEIESYVEDYRTDGNSRRVLEKMVPFCIRYLRNRFDADEDTISEVLLKMTVNIDYILKRYLATGYRGCFSFWMMTILRRNFLDRKRRQKSANRLKMVPHPSGHFGQVSKPVLKLDGYLARLTMLEECTVRLLFGFETGVREFRYLIRQMGCSRVKLRRFFKTVSERRVAFELRRQKVLGSLDRLKQMIDRLEPADYRRRQNNLNTLIEHYSSPVTMADVGRLYGWHRSNIKRIKIRALYKLGRAIPAHLWHEQTRHRPVFFEYQSGQVK